jgi:predicted amidohydrolase
MRVGFLQFRPARFDAASNLSFIERCLRGAGADLVVLPELALTGYLFPSRQRLEQCAESLPGPSTDRLEKICRRQRLHVVCGMAEKAGGAVFNSAAVVGPEGYLGTYRKTHLFLDEKDLFEPGDTGFRIFEMEGARVGVLICFDWIFPEASRTLALMGADVIAHASNLVLPHAQGAVVTRCLENRIYWIVANRSGEEREGARRLVFTGGSRIVSPTGEILVQSSRKTPSLSIADVDPHRARDKRITPRNDVMADRRPEMYEGLR